MSADQQPRTLPQPLRGQRDPEGRRRAILAAAAELIAEGGASCLTHRSVAARAGVSLGSTTQYFASLDEMREAALQQLSDEIDTALTEMQPAAARILETPELFAAQVHRYLLDSRVVRADIALMTAATTDHRLRPLALRWFERVVDMLAGTIGRERATAIAVYVDGTTMHAGLHRSPLDLAEMTRTVAALATMPDPSPEQRS